MTLRKKVLPFEVTDDYLHLAEILESTREEFVKAQTGNKSAGLRLRKLLKELETESKGIRAKWNQKSLENLTNQL